MQHFDPARGTFRVPKSKTQPIMRQGKTARKREAAQARRAQV